VTRLTQKEIEVIAGVRPRVALSAIQRNLLRRSVAGTMSDGSGRGAEIYGDEARSAEALQRRGLITISCPHSGAPWGWARVTDEGREIWKYYQDLPKS
jgi:hypothetical protein